ncbi:TRAP transporter small permease [Actimicrobium sp. CCC2.4]|uniref:TRAP transporter small permease n=1 Tax=Actimicrobium sp. CCC2.4 TaxID=3048606 RepID=UPI002AC99947|nr:TRAP transporter small permease [Actimicrobium sp. CCC2.4]MEB0136791.1 TRAP transporter small permease [Actimicrobium sp. CCC2.4]WPX33930.1 TRAP transporter small permease [Actimicrobium sp. CCC2.4]
MSHGFELEPVKGPAEPDHPLVAKLSRALDAFNRGLLMLSMGALILTALVLTYSVVSRYFFKLPTDWQDEASVFMLVGVTFFCCAYVQALRGHIGIEALASILSPRVNAARMMFVDVMSLLFCLFFSWKSWALFHEAYVEGFTTSSTFAPPLWIPYGMMAFGMSLLALQIAMQILVRATNKTNERSAP